MDEGFLQERTLRLDSARDRQALHAFLARQGLGMDEDIEYATAVVLEGEIVAAGSFSGRVLKCIAVDRAYQEQGLSAKVVTNLLSEQYRRGRTHLFLYTKPENSAVFSGLGFYPIAEVPGRAVLMENRPDGIKRYLEGLSAAPHAPGLPAAVVVNCNPFTLGHRYLLEYASARCGCLHVFVVWEDRSVFPAETRYKLVREGTAHLNNIALHKGRDYIISSATFPTYFIKEYRDQTETHARLDLKVFSGHIAPALGIKRRFVGNEPYCAVTETYNDWMKRLLPESGIEVFEVPRFEIGGQAVSASRVRMLLGQGELQRVKELVPETTWRFLVSDEARAIVSRIRGQGLS